MKVQYTVVATDEKGRQMFYTGRGFSSNPDLAIQSNSIESADLYVTWGKRDHPRWRNWLVRISEAASERDDPDAALNEMRQRLVTCEAVSEPHSYAVCSCTEGHHNPQLAA